MAKLVKIGAVAFGALALLAGCGSLSGQDPKPAPTPTVTVTSAPAATVTVTQTPSAAKTTAAATANSTQQRSFPTGQVVDAAAFNVGHGGHAWVSPTGRIYCGVLDHGTWVTAGCQMMSPLPPCGDNPDVSAPGVQWTSNEPVKSICYNQGIFISPNNRTLEYGQQINVGDYTAVSQRDGMYMRNNKTGEATKVAAEGIQVF